MLGNLPVFLTEVSFEMMTSGLLPFRKFRIPYCRLIPLMMAPTDGKHCAWVQDPGPSFPCRQIQAKALFPFHQHSAWEWNANKTEEVRRPKNLIRRRISTESRELDPGNFPKGTPLACSPPQVEDRAALSPGFSAGC